MDFPNIILIVDDELAGREALEGVLFLEGYQLFFAENGQEACDKAIEITPDVILLDVMMPQMDGFEVCKILRANPLTKDIPILLITALDDRTSRLHGIEAGADDFITKPFDRVELRARVRTITRLNRYRRIIQERTRFSWVVEQAHDGYVVVDTSDRLIFANRAACTFLNIPSDLNIPGAFHEWVANQFACEPEEEWASWPALSNPEAPLFLIKSASQVSQTIWFQVEVLALTANVDETFLIKISEVSNRLALQQEIWSFQSMLTHKLLTPFSQISMSAELIARRAQLAEDREMNSLADAVLSGTRRVAQEVKDMLGYLNAPSLAQTGILFDAADFEETIRAVCRQVSVPRLVIGGGKFPKGSFVCLTDRAMDIILHELVENSKKFHPRLTPTIEASLTRYDDNQLILILRDDGIHLTPEQLRQAWIPYYQAEKTFTGEVAGMGLGLSTVATLVWEIGGKYHLYNRKDRPGVITELILPVNVASSSAGK